MDDINIVILEVNDQVLHKFSPLSAKATKIFSAKDYSELELIFSQNLIQLVIFSMSSYEDNPAIRQFVRRQEYLVAIYGNREDSSVRSNLISRGIWLYWNINNGISELEDQLVLLKLRKKMVDHLKQSADTRGNLTDISLGEVLTNLSFKQRSAKLTVYSVFGRSLMFFTDGTLTHARQGRLRGNAAVLNTFIWPSGSYFIQDSDPPNITPTVTASFVALIAEGTYRKEQFWNYWSMKLNFNSPLIVRDKNPKSLTPRINNLMQWITRQNSLLQILLFSESDAWQLVHDFDSLIEKKIIEYIPDSDNIISRDGYSPEVKSFFTNTEALALERVLFADKTNIKEGKFIVAGASGSGLIDFIRTISGKMSSPLKQVQNLLFSRILLAEKYISFFGVTIEQKFTDFIQKLSDNMFGFILLIDARNKTELEFTSYVIKSLFSSYPEAIFAVGLTHSEKARALPMAVIKQTIQLPKFINLYICDIEDPNSIKELVFSLREIPRSNSLV